MFHKDKQVPRKVHQQAPLQQQTDPPLDEQQLQNVDSPLHHGDSLQQHADLSQHGDLIQQLQQSGLLQQLLDGNLLQQLQRVGQSSQQLQRTDHPLQHGVPPQVVLVAPLAEDRDDQEDENTGSNLTNFESRYFCLVFAHSKCFITWFFNTTWPENLVRYLGVIKGQATCAVRVAMEITVITLGRRGW